MLIRRLEDCPEFMAGDQCQLREFLHPNRQDVDVRYSLAIARVAPGGRTLSHVLTTTEVYYILQGTGCMHVDGEACDVSAHQVVYIPANARQHIVNTGEIELQFLCICDPPWQPGTLNIRYDRVITRIEGNRIFVDAPLAT